MVEMAVGFSRRADQLQPSCYCARKRPARKRTAPINHATLEVNRLRAFAWRRRQPILKGEAVIAAEVPSERVWGLGLRPRPPLALNLPAGALRSPGKWERCIRGRAR